ILDQRGADARGVRIGRRNARETVDLRTAKRRRVLDRAIDAVAELALPPWNAPDAALARRPIAGGQVVQHLLKTMVAQARNQLFLAVRIRKQVFHRLESCVARGGEAVE